ncbi:hypothetical protein C8F01DRAFT_1258902 [Mycena amicta]|nr:hypothetical protein C8F01DRAFT_1258902 [Mycena amicta]
MSDLAQISQAPPAALRSFRLRLLCVSTPSLRPGHSYRLEFSTQQLVAGLIAAVTTPSARLSSSSVFPLSIDVPLEYHIHPPEVSAVRTPSQSLSDRDLYDAAADTDTTYKHRVFHLVVPPPSGSETPYAPPGTAPACKLGF